MNVQRGTVQCGPRDPHGNQVCFWFLITGQRDRRGQSAESEFLDQVGSDALALNKGIVAGRAAAEQGRASAKQVKASTTYIVGKCMCACMCVCESAMPARPHAIRPFNQSFHLLCDEAVSKVTPAGRAPVQAWPDSTVSEGLVVNTVRGAVLVIVTNRIFLSKRRAPSLQVSRHASLTRCKRRGSG